MRRGFRTVVCAAVLAAALCAPAVAAPANGQLAVVADGRLVAVNPDGTGLRGLLPNADRVGELAFSPDGNRLAFVDDGRIAVLDLPSGHVATLTAGPDDANPGWSGDGITVAFRRGSATYRVAAAGGAARPGPEALPAGTTAVAWAPGLAALTPVVGGRLSLPGLAEPHTIAGAPAWAPDGETLAFADRDGVAAVRGDALRRLADPPAAAPRWSPDGRAVVYAAGAELREVRAETGAARTVLTAQRIGAVDWQPCVERTVSCRSVAPPRCSASVQVTTTLAGEPIDLPAPPCSDPAGLALTVTLVQGPAHGTLSGLRYTPTPGFAGEDTVVYRVSNGSGESDPVRVTIFVVQRPLAVAEPAPAPTPTVRRAPFLSARAAPWLNRRRRTRVRVVCDQDCTLTVRLTATVRRRRAARSSRAAGRAAAARSSAAAARAAAMRRAAMRAAATRPAAARATAMRAAAARATAMHAAAARGSARRAAARRAAARRAAAARGSARRTVRGPRVTRRARARQVLTLRLRLPSAPRGSVLTAWLTGRVRNAAGDARAVRLPVRIRR